MNVDIARIAQEAEVVGRDRAGGTQFIATPTNASSKIRICYLRIWCAKEPETRKIHKLPRPLDPSLTLTRTQYPAILGNRGNKKPFAYAGFANLCNVQQPLTAHS